MFGDEALKLIKEARRSTATDTLRPYSDETVRSVCRETRLLMDDIQANVAARGAALSTDQGQACALVVQHLAAQRNKRLLLAYHHHRLERLKDAFWSTGGALDHLLSERAFRQALSPAELDFLKAYDELLLDYKSEFDDVLDVTAAGGHLAPPKDLFVQVRVVKDAGSIQTEGGTLELRKNEQFFERRTDLERLILQGYLEVIE